MTTAHPRDDLKIESCPLHTERPEFAARAPEQAKAALKRGAAAIGFTELGPTKAALRAEIATLCHEHGYVLLETASDATLAYRADLVDAKTGVRQVDAHRARNHVSFTFHGRTVTVFADHWETLTRDPHGTIRDEQTHTMVDDMDAASAGSGVSFFVADANPSRPQRDPSGEPHKTLEAHGIVTVWTELGTFPKGVGVTMIGRNKHDTSVRAESVKLFPALGSDHQPAVAVYSIARHVAPHVPSAPHGFMPGAIIKNIAPGSSDPAITPCGVIQHIAVSNSDSLFGLFSNDGGIESHFYIRKDGTIEQYRSIFRQADAEFDGNLFAAHPGKGFVSVEHQGGVGADLGRPMPKAQLDAFHRVIRFVHQESAFPLRVCPAWDEGGIGYHALFDQWNLNHHSCPGAARIKQFHDVTVPWLKGLTA